MIDLDNTLGNRTASVRAWIAEFCSDYGFGSEAADWILERDNDGYSSRVEVFDAIVEQFGITEPAEKLLAAYQTRVVDLAAPTVGALECLHNMRSRGWSIAIVTNGSSKQQHGKIDAIGIRSSVDAVIVSGDLGIKKPDPQIFKAAANATQQSLEGAWMVGDAALHDVVGAQQLGLNTAWLHRGRTWPTEHHPPTVILDDLTQLVDAIHAHL